MHTTHPQLDPQDTVLSTHPPRFPRLYRLKRGLTILGLILIGLALGGEVLLIVLGIMPGGSALLLLLFTAALAVPLLIGSALTPPLTVTLAGLALQPMFGGPLHVPWEAIRELRLYTLLPVDEPVARLLIGAANMPRRDGRWVVVDGALPLTFRLAAWLGGLGNHAAFAISDASHRDYAALLTAIEAHTAPH
jgi:hypothetical protein